MGSPGNAPRWRTWTTAAGVAVVAAVVFQSARHGAFLHWDDDINIVENPHLRGLSWEHVRWMFSDVAYMRRYVPLTWLGWAMEYELFGLTALSAHVGNLLLHALNAALVYLLVQRVLGLADRAGAIPEARRRWAAAAGALFWALHPLRVEVVAWASGRIYCQTACLLLLATLAYLEAATRPPGAPGRRGWWWGTHVAFAASLLTYPPAITFVAVLVVADVFLLGRIRLGAGTWSEAGSRAAWLEKLPLLGLSLAVAGATMWARFTAQGIWLRPPTLAEFGVGERAMQAFYMWAHYLWRPWLPLGLTPVDPVLVDFSPWSLPLLASAAGVLGLTVLLGWQRRRWPGALGLWLAHLCLLVPVLGLTEHPQFPSDRYSYLQGVLWALALAALLLWWRARSSRAAVALGGGAALLACGLASAAQIRVWRDDEALFRHAYLRLGSHPYRADLAMRLGDTLRRRGRLDEAAGFYRETLALEPTGGRAAVAALGLAQIEQAAGRLEPALARYREALAAKGDLPDIAAAYAELLLGCGRPGEAVAPLRRALAAHPDDPALQHRLGLALLRSGDAAEAAATLGAAVRHAPAHVALWGDLVLALLSAGHPAPALARAEEAVRLHPQAAEAYLALARALRATARPQEALRATERAVLLDPALAAAQELRAQLQAAGAGR